MELELSTDGKEWKKVVCCESFSISNEKMKCYEAEQPIKSDDNLTAMRKMTKEQFPDANDVQIDFIILQFLYGMYDAIVADGLIGEVTKES